MRGANDVNKRRIIKSVVRKQKVDLFCIQETKIQLMTDGVVKSLGVGRFLDWRTIRGSWGSWRCADLLGQKVLGTVGVGGGPILNFL